MAPIDAPAAPREKGDGSAIGGFAALGRSWVMTVSSPT
jgi:hypothetical protein